MALKSQIASSKSLLSCLVSHTELTVHFALTLHKIADHIIRMETLNTEQFHALQRMQSNLIAQAACSSKPDRFLHDGLGRSCPSKHLALQPLPPLGDMAPTRTVAQHSAVWRRQEAEFPSRI